MSILMQLFVGWNIFLHFFLAYAWKRTTIINLFFKFMFTMTGGVWTLYLLVSLGYLGGN